MDLDRSKLLAALDHLAEAGHAADQQLAAEERRVAVADPPLSDERPVQTLGALSRELWAAHSALQRALRASAEIRMLQTDSGRVG